MDVAFELHLDLPVISVMRAQVDWRRVDWAHVEVVHHGLAGGAEIIHVSLKMMSEPSSAQVSASKSA